MKSTTLGQSPINGGSISITLVEDTAEPAAYRQPARIHIAWPLTTMTSVKDFPGLAAEVVRLFASAATKLANIKVSRPR